MTGNESNKKDMSEKDWKSRLSDDEYVVLRQQGTEPPGTSPLNTEKREGDYVCAGCGQTLFTSDMKYDSGSGWPSFYKAIDDNIETRTDNSLASPRIEYHCAHCGGHQGHVFPDGPEPTGLRYCNNGTALRFIAQNNAS
jgi:peptide-methionine (R)-S-oxide reductase